MLKITKPRTSKSLLAVTLTLMMACAGLLPPGVSHAASQPKITWSENHIAVEVSRGGSTVRRLTFTSDQNLQDVSIEPVPALSDLVSLQPNAIHTVFADQAQAVSLLVSAPADAATGHREGTIHLRSGSQTLPDTLKVEVDVKDGPVEVPDADAAQDIVSPATVSLSGASETAFNPRSVNLRFDVAGATLNTDPSTISVAVNDVLVPATSVQIGSSSVTVPVVLAEGSNDVELFASDTKTRMIYKEATLWAGGYTMQVAVYDENGQPSTGTLVTARLGDDKEVTATATSSSGSVFFNNLPNWTIILEASASSNRIASVATNGGAGFAQLRLRAFNAPSTIDNDDFSLGTAGWNIGTAPVFIIPHDEGTFVPLEEPSAAQTIQTAASTTQTSAATQPSGEMAVAGTASPSISPSRAELHARAGVPAAVRQNNVQQSSVQQAATAPSGGDVVTALAAAEADNDLVLATSGEGPQTISRTLNVEPGTLEVKVRYKFVTSEVPGGWFGTQYNDYFNISLRSQAGGSGSESQTMNGLGLSSFDAGGATDWREFTLPVNENGDTVQVDATVANVADGLFDSYLVIDVVAKPKVKIGDLVAVVKNDTATVNVKMSTNAPTDVTLTLLMKSGTGAAVFDSTSSTTMTINATTDVVIRGVTESSTRDNIRLQATRSDGKKLDDEDFSVLWVTLQLRTSGTVSSDNSAKNAIKSAMGTLALGTLRSTGATAAKIWRNTVEIMGTVSPLNFKGKIKMPRYRILSQYYYNNALQLTRTAGLDDLPGADVLRDFDPKPKGHVFDFDGPGIDFSGVVSNTGDTRRQRVNFQQYATYEEKGQTKKASGDLFWYARISIIKTATGDALATDVPGDNQAATGSTPLTWNLQP
jgi:hypothetical protein